MNWSRFNEINNVSKLYQSCSIDNLKECKQLALEFIKKPFSILITGPCGTGKTYFMYCLVKALFEKRFYEIGRVKFINAKKLSDDIQQEYKTYGSTKYEIEKCLEVDVLFIDDFGVQATTDRMERDFYQICDVRLSDFRPTIFSTNLNDDDMQRIFGARISSRLKMCTRLQFSGEDKRDSID